MHFKRRWLFVLLAAGAVLLLPSAEAISVYYGELKPGLQLVREGRKKSYFVYAPSYYTQQKDWPLVVALFEWGSDPKQYLEGWIAEAEKRGYLVLCPDWWKSRDAAPFEGDRWVLRILRKVIEKYRVDRKRILLTGFADGADYAYYLALRYPQRFSAAAPVGGALGPVYGDFIYYGRIKRHPIPFYALNSKKDVGLEDRFITLEDVRKGIEKLRGYRLDVRYQEMNGLGHEYREDFNTSILDWFESKLKR